MTTEAPPPIPDAAKSEVRGYLLVARLAGEITEKEFTEFGRSLGVFEPSETEKTA